MSIELKQAAEKALVVLGSATSFMSRKARDQHESVVAELSAAIQQAEAQPAEGQPPEGFVSGQTYKQLFELNEKNAERILALEDELDALKSAQPADGGEPLFILHCGQIDSSGEQDEWETEANGQQRVDDFCRLHPGKKIKLYPAPPAIQQAEDQQPATGEPVLFIHPDTFAMNNAHVGAWKPGYELPGYIPLYTPSVPADVVRDAISTVREHYRGNDWGKAAESICDAIDAAMLAAKDASA